MIISVTVSVSVCGSSVVVSVAVYYAVRRNKRNKGSKCNISRESNCL